MDYIKNPPLDAKGNMVEPNNLKFEASKHFSRTKLWKDHNDTWEKWVEKIQCRRNSIHSFNSRDIGTAEEFLHDVDEFVKFIKIINNRIPYPDEMYP